MAKLFQACEFTFSKKILSNLFENHDKYYYKNLEEPHNFYDFPKCMIFEENKTKSDESAQKNAEGEMFIKNGNVYNVNHLIEQNEKDERIISILKEKLKSSTNKIGRFNWLFKLNLKMLFIIENQSKKIDDLESRQKKMSSTIDKLNDEVSSFKKDKEVIKGKVLYYPLKNINLLIQFFLV